MVNGILFNSMWGGRSFFKIRDGWAKWDAGEWASIQLPRVRVPSMAARDSLRAVRVARWESWIVTVQDCRRKIRTMLRKRSNQWNKFLQDQKRNRRDTDYDEGYTRSLVRSVFPEMQPGEPASFYDGENWISDPKIVANKAATVFQNLSADTSWNTDYAVDPVFTSGPWKNCDRLTEDMHSVLHSGRCGDIRGELELALEPIDLKEYLTLLKKKSADSAAGVTGLSYGLLRSMPTTFQRISCHFRNLVVLSQTVPDSLADLVIVAIPKSSSSVTGYAGCRPISLYETPLVWLHGFYQQILDQIKQ